MIATTIQYGLSLLLGYLGGMAIDRWYRPVVPTLEDLRLDSVPDERDHRGAKFCASCLAIGLVVSLPFWFDSSSAVDPLGMAVTSGLFWGGGLLVRNTYLLRHILRSAPPSADLEDLRGALSMRMLICVSVVLILGTMLVGSIGIVALDTIGLADYRSDPFDLRKLEDCKSILILVFLACPWRLLISFSRPSPSSAITVDSGIELTPLPTLLNMGDSIKMTVANFVGHWLMGLFTALELLMMIIDHSRVDLNTYREPILSFLRVSWAWQFHNILPWSLTLMVHIGLVCCVLEILGRILPTNEISVPKNVDLAILVIGSVFFASCFGFLAVCGVPFIEFEHGLR